MRMTIRSSFLFSSMKSLGTLAKKNKVFTDNKKKKLMTLDIYTIHLKVYKSDCVYKKKV